MRASAVGSGRLARKGTKVSRSMGACEKFATQLSFHCSRSQSIASACWKTSAMLAGVTGRFL